MGGQASSRHPKIIVRSLLEYVSYRVAIRLSRLQLTTAGHGRVRCATPHEPRRRIHTCIHVYIFIVWLYFSLDQCGRCGEQA